MYKDREGDEEREGERERERETEKERERKREAEMYRPIARCMIPVWEQNAIVTYWG
jgi:hypothetical protein